MTIPTKIQRAIAVSGIKTAVIPQFNSGLADGRASYDGGFPAENFIPKTSGGIPPWGEDMNAYLYAISDLSKFYSSGGVFKHDSSHQSAIGGYPLGSLVLQNNNMGYSLSTGDNNMNNPNGVTGWAKVSIERKASRAGGATNYTASYDPPITELYDGLEVTLDTTATGTNSVTTPTFSPNGIASKAIQKDGTTMLPGDIPRLAKLMYSTLLDRWTLLNPLISNAIANIPAGGVIPSFATITDVVNSNYSNVMNSPYTLKYGMGYSLGGIMGYIRFPVWLGGFMLQWYNTTSNINSEIYFSYMANFPNNFIGGLVCEGHAAGWLSNSSTVWGIRELGIGTCRAIVRDVTTTSVSLPGSGVAGIVLVWGR